MKPPWHVNKTQTFIRCVESEKISKNTVEAIEAWVKDVRLIHLKSFRLVYVSPARTFQIWNAKIPDPDSQKGKTGGFRLVCFFVKAENNVNAVYLDLIEKRKDLGFKNEHPKDKQCYDRQIENLKKELMKIYEK